MNISVILCTWNNSTRLDITLSSFLAIELPPNVTWEMIVVNNNSTDDTHDIVSRHLGKLPIVYVEESTQGLSHARNSGLQNAKGELIIFTDDDVKPCKNWLHLFWQAYQRNPDGYFWGGPIESEFEKTPDDMELIRLGPCSVKGLDWGKHQRFLDFNIGEYFIAANWGCPAKGFNTVGGFNLSLGLNPSTGKVLVGEESELMNRLIINNWKPIYLPDAKIQHFVPKTKMTLTHIASRAEAFGRTLADKDDLRNAKHLFGVPRWMLVRLFLLWKNYLIRKSTGKKYYNDYLSFRRLKGNILSLLDKKSQ